MNSPKCPNCGNEMKIRTAHYGEFTGNRFWGCSNYPECKCIVDFMEEPLSDNDKNIIWIESIVTMKFILTNEIAKYRLVYRPKAYDDNTGKIIFLPLSEDELSIDSNLGKALIGKRLGDELDYLTQIGIQKVIILAVDNTHQY